MLLEDLKVHYKTWANMTRKLELGSTTYLGWVKKGFIPFSTQLIIQDKTRGKFKALKSHAKPLDEISEAEE